MGWSFTHHGKREHVDRLPARYSSRMMLAFIYGAPAVGKLTMARAVAALTGFRVFHNHVAFDFAESIFDFPSPRPLRALDPETRAGEEPALRLSAQFRAMTYRRSYSRCSPRRLKRTLGALGD